MKCNKCGSDMWDNRKTNAERKAQGKTSMPDYKCKNKACGSIIWPPKDNTPIQVSTYQVPIDKNEFSGQTFTSDDEALETMLDSRDDQGPDWDEIRRKDYRWRAISELIRYNGLIELSEEQKDMISKLVDYAMTGK